MLAEKSHKDYARKLVSLSLDEAGRISDERVNAILQVLKEKPPRQLKLILKIYLYYIKQEIRRSEAVLEYAGEIQPAAVEAIERDLSSRYHRSVSSVTRENPDLIAGLRVTIGDDVYDASVAGHLEKLATNVK